MKRRNAVRVIDIDPDTIPANCHHIVVTHNNARIIIKHGPQNEESSIIIKQAMIMRRVHEFFSIKENFDKVRALLLQTSHVSLRILDWCVTNWTRTHRVILDVDRGTRTDKVNVHLDYKAHLKAYSKRSFDPFCRRERILVHFTCDPDKKTYVSTPAQMNFFKWAIGVGVLAYCEANIDIIEADMVDRMRLRVNPPIR